MFRWAVISLVISLIAGGFGLTNVSILARRIALVLFAVFFVGFLALLGFAYLVAGMVSPTALLSGAIVPADL